MPVHSVCALILEEKRRNSAHACSTRSERLRREGPRVLEDACLHKQWHFRTLLKRCISPSAVGANGSRVWMTFSIINMPARLQSYSLVIKDRMRIDFHRVREHVWSHASPCCVLTDRSYPSIRARFAGELADWKHTFCHNSAWSQLSC